MLLDYVGYKPNDLRAAYRDKLAAAGLSGDAAKSIDAALEAGLTGYTYLGKPDRAVMQNATPLNVCRQSHSPTAPAQPSATIHGLNVEIKARS